MNTIMRKTNGIQWIVASGIVFCFIVTAVIIANIGTDQAEKKQRQYEAAIQTQDESEFQELLELKDSPILAYGTVTARDPVTYPDLSGMKFLSLRVERQEKKENEDETDWEWDTYDWSNWQCDEVQFLGCDFSYASFSGISNNYHETKYDSSWLWRDDRRNVFDGATEQSGTLFVSFQDGNRKLKFYEGKDIDTVRSQSGSRLGLWLFLGLVWFPIGVVLAYFTGRWAKKKW